VCFFEAVPLLLPKLRIMKHHTLRITLSVLLTGAAIIFTTQFFILDLEKDQRYLLVVQALLFLFLASANYTDRHTALLGHHKTHLAILIILAIVLSINGYVLMTKGESTDALSHFTKLK
jgi:hypothetical protein